ncbi:MAG: M3 family oligoendopeptidase [Pseudomonadota bacterium]
MPIAAKNPFSAVSTDLPEWDLSDLYPGMDSPEITAEKTGLEKDTKAFADRFKGKLEALAKDKAEDLGSAIQFYETLQDKIGRLISYADLVYTGDTSDPARTKFYGDMQEFITSLATQLLFFELELNRIDDKVIDTAIKTSKTLSHYTPWLNDLRREKPHQLSDEIEQLFVEKSVSARAGWNRLFDETVTSLRFTVRGKEQSLEPTLNDMMDADEQVRREASDALAKTFRENLRVFTLIINTLAKDKEINDRWHKFSDIADSRHLSNRVEREVVEALIDTVRTAYPRLSHRYYALKAKWFGKEKLNHWDRNAPLPAVELKNYQWDDARETVLSSFKRFSPEMSELAENFFTKNWIDAPVRPGKATGAFSHPTVPSAHPYVLLNYMGKPRDVMTLAHELGHGVHQMLAAHNGALMAPTPLTLAETASVFGEMLTFRLILDETKDKKQRKAMLASKVEDMLNTVVRQIALYTFEREVHTARQKGELTADDINAIWMKVQSESLGPAVNLGAGYETFWTYISHFIHSPFYVYAYAFGDCLVNSLYALYEKADAGFVDKYFALLSAGGSKPYGELLEPFGLDPKRGDFWKLGLQLLDNMITELEALD